MGCRLTPQRGQSRLWSEFARARLAGAPQCEQNFAPWKIIPKHEGHATVARRELQCAQRVASEATAAPQLGQFNA